MEWVQELSVIEHVLVAVPMIAIPIGAVYIANRIRNSRKRHKEARGER